MPRHENNNIYSIRTIQTYNAPETPLKISLSPSRNFCSNFYTPWAKAPKDFFQQKIPRRFQQSLKQRQSKPLLLKRQSSLYKFI